MKRILFTASLIALLLIQGCSTGSNDTITKIDSHLTSDRQLDILTHKVGDIIKQSPFFNMEYSLSVKDAVAYLNEVLNYTDDLTNRDCTIETCLRVRTTISYLLLTPSGVMNFFEST